MSVDIYSYPSGNTAYLLVSADCFIQLKTLFQEPLISFTKNTGEVLPGGVKIIVESGLIDDLNANYAIHLLPIGSAGTVGYHAVIYGNYE